MLADYPAGRPRTPDRFGFRAAGTDSIMKEHRERENIEEAPENQPEEPGAEGGADSPAADQLPGAPADDDSAVGDTDQHSTA
jgi:hypothetical protein